MFPGKVPQYLFVVFFEPHLDGCPVKVVQFCNHVYLCLAVCVSISSTGASDTRKIASNTDKRITKGKKRYKKARKVPFVRSIIVDE